MINSMGKAWLLTLFACLLVLKVGIECLACTLPVHYILSHLFIFYFEAQSLSKLPMLALNSVCAQADFEFTIMLPQPWAYRPKPWGPDDN